MNIRFSAKAAEDIVDEVTFVAERNQRSALHLRESLEALLIKLEGGAFEGPEKTLTTGERVRSWFFSPWHVYYQRRADEFFVVRVYNQSRRPITRQPRRRRRK